MEDPERRGSGRIRREEVLDEDGNFVVASFEEGRDKPKKAKNRGAGRIPESGFRHRYRVEVGHKDNVKPGAIVGAITNEGGVDGKDLGRIDIFPTFSLVDMALPLTDDAERKIGRATISGRQLRIKKDRGPSKYNHESADRRESRHRDRRKNRLKTGATVVAFVTRSAA